MRQSEIICGILCIICILLGAIQVNAQDSLNVTMVGYINLPYCGMLGYDFDVVVAGNYAYVLDADYGVRVVDVSNPSSPFEAGFYDPSDNPQGIAVSRSYAYVCAGGLRVVNILNPSNPFEVGFCDTLGLYNPYGVAVFANYAYLACRNEGLYIVNIQDPSNPVVVGSCDTPGDAWEVAASGSYAYVADRNSGLRIINVVNPADPQEIGHYDAPGAAYGVEVLGNYAYVADDWAGLRVLDISNPYNPVEVGYYISLGQVLDLAVSNDYAFLANRPTGLRVVNIANPVNPMEVGYYNMYGAATANQPGIAVSGNYVYVVNEFYLGIFDCSQALSVPISEHPEVLIRCSLLPAYPNPFNPTTTVSFTLLTPARVSLSIFDITGRQITTLVNDWQDKGNHRMVFDGSDLVSGTYFCQLKAGDFTGVQKIILLK